MVVFWKPIVELIAVAGSLAGVAALWLQLFGKSAGEVRESIADPDYRRELAGELRGTRIGDIYQATLRNGLTSLDQHFGNPRSAQALGVCFIVSVVYAWAAFFVGFAVSGNGNLGDFWLIPPTPDAIARTVAAIVACFSPLLAYLAGRLIGYWVRRSRQKFRRWLSSYSIVRLETTGRFALFLIWIAFCVFVGILIQLNIEIPRYGEGPGKPQRDLFYAIAVLISIVGPIAGVAAARYRTRSFLGLQLNSALSLWIALALAFVLSCALALIALGSKELNIIDDDIIILASTSAIAAVFSSNRTKTSIKFLLFSFSWAICIVFLSQIDSSDLQPKTYHDHGGVALKTLLSCMIISLFSKLKLLNIFVGYLSVSIVGGSAAAADYMLDLQYMSAAENTFAATIMVTAAAGSVGAAHAKRRQRGAMAGGIGALVGIGIFDVGNRFHNFGAFVDLLLVFFLVLPLLNSLWDWFSWIVSRTLGRHLLDRLHEENRAWTICWHGSVDLLVGIILLASMAFSISFGFEVYHQLTAPNQEIAATFKLESFIKQATTQPLGEGLWLTTMLLSTLVPTVLHLVLILVGPAVLVFVSTKRRIALAEDLDSYSNLPHRNSLALSRLSDEMCHFNHDEFQANVKRRAVLYVTRERRLAFIGATALSGIVVTMILSVVTVIHPAGVTGFVEYVALIGVSLAQKITSSISPWL